MTTELITVSGETAIAMPVMSIQQATQRYQQMKEFVGSILKEGVDFGTIPGTNRDTLLKPGAEKLTTFFGLTPKFTAIERKEAWDAAEPFFYYWFRCHLYHGTSLVAEGDGSCNSRESRYRWRWVPKSDLGGVDANALKSRSGSKVEFAFAVKKGETSGKYGKPQEHWQEFRDAIENGTAKEITRSTRGGRKLGAWEIGSTLYRVPNEDIASQVNTILKMAQKRALVAATLIGVNASDYFTQDLEDLDYGVVVEGAVTDISKSASTPKKPSEVQPPVEMTLETAMNRISPKGTAFGTMGEQELNTVLDWATSHKTNPRAAEDKAAAELLITYLEVDEQERKALE